MRPIQEGLEQEWAEKPPVSSKHFNKYILDYPYCVRDDARILSGRSNIFVGEIRSKLGRVVLRCVNTSYLLVSTTALSNKCAQKRIREHHQARAITYYNFA